MKALIAGAAGFIGSHLADGLLAAGHLAVGVDNYFIGTKENIAHLNNVPGFRMYEQDLCDLAALKKLFAEEKPDYVFHLAANSDIRASAADPGIEYRNTFSTTFCLLECMRLYGVKKLFFASTSAVYGEKTGVYTAEDSAGLEPVSYYGGCKLGSEGIISAYTYMNDMQTLVFRFPNVIGPRLTHGVVYDFINKLQADPSKLCILGDGRQSKPYIYVTDLIQAILQFMETGRQGVALYNVGVDTQTTVTRIADIVSTKMGLAGIPYHYTGGRAGWKGDVPQYQYNLNKIHHAGWHAAHTSDEAVMLTVEDVLAQKAGKTGG